MSGRRPWLEELAACLADGQPVSRVFGFDRGTPIDRRYIERFLEERRAFIRGRVLEVGDSTYTRRFGGSAVTRADVLHVDSTAVPNAIVTNLAAGAPELETGAYDCVVLTQTLHCIYDVRAAIGAARRALRPGGTLLATFPGITQISRYDMDRWGDYWRLTRLSAERLFEEVCPGDAVDVQSFGNAATATAMINGLAVEELPSAMFEEHDPDYEVTIAVALHKAGFPPKPAADAPVRGIVLMYHRVTTLETDPQLLAVRPDRFAAHLDALARRFDVVPLETLAHGTATTSRPMVAITFDDGYADNLLEAKPRMAACGLPSTVFVSTGGLGQDGEFWWDELERLLLLPARLPSSVALDVDGQTVTADFGPAAVLTEAERKELSGWTVIDGTDPTPRHTLYRTLHRRLFDIGDPDRRLACLAELARQTGQPYAGRPSHRCLTPDEVRALADGGLVEVGAHGIHHPSLGRLSLEEQRREIAGSKARLEALLGRTVHSFAYPFGGSGTYDPATLELLARAGIRTAVTTRPDPVRAGDHPLLIPRLCVRDIDSDALVRQLDALFAGPAAGRQVQ